jgi:hypothetical protein
MTENKITMPASYAVLNADEMMYTDGGARNNDGVALGGTIALGSLIVGSLMMIPVNNCSTRLKEIDETMEQDIYNQTILYLKEHTDANQMLADYEARAAYQESDRYQELMNEVSALKTRANLWTLGAVGTMLVGFIGGGMIAQS